MSRRTEAIVMALVAMAFAFIIHIQRKDLKYSWEKDLEYRYSVDFVKTKDQVKDFIKQYVPYVTDEMIDQWTKQEKLESRVIDGELRYFRNTARNLFRVDPELKHVFDSVEAVKAGKSIEQYINDDEYDPNDAVNLPEIIAGVKATGNHIAAPKRMRVRYTLTVEPDAVPAGKMIKCWLPFPRNDIARQTNVKFIEAGVHDLKITDSTDRRITFGQDNSVHSSLFMKASSLKGKPTTFYEVFEYTSSGEWYDLNEADILPYDTTTELYKKYTSERDAHVVFTPGLVELAHKITDGIDSPLEKARAIFDFIDPYPWSSAIEYSTIPNIPEYVAHLKRGDCGQQSLLFITLCRIAGIPAHFQSGFMMHPNGENMHDWSEIYFEGIGWVPVDMSFGKPDYAKGEYLEQNPDTKYFFLGGIDSWRMVVNSDFGMKFYPPKKYPRSETVDFQRGEVEWAKGNLYFSQWDWNLEIEYL